MKTKKEIIKQLEEMYEEGFKGRVNSYRLGYINALEWVLGKKEAEKIFKKIQKRFYS